MAIRMIRVPKTPRKAFNPRRKASNLLRAQVENLELAAGPSYAEAGRRKALKTTRRPGSVRTEQQAASYVLTMTCRLNTDAAQDEAVRAVAATPRPRRKARGRTRSGAARKKTARRKGARKR